MKNTFKMRPVVIVSLLMTVGLFAQSCMDLEEETFNLLEAKVYYRNKASIEGVIGRIYTKNDNVEESFTELAELPSDQIQWRTWSGGNFGWDEGARYYVSIQQWTPKTTRIAGAWNDGFVTLGLCNSALDDFKTLNPEKLGITQAQLDGYINEVRTLRAWVYYRMYEIYGGVLPLVTSIDASVLPPSASSNFAEGNKIIYDFLVKELDETLPSLPKKVSNRMNQAVNRILKARLLLNANLFIGENHYAECEALSQQILDGVYGSYSLAARYQDNVAHNNDQVSPEVIFAASWGEGYYQNKNYRVATFISSNTVRNYFGTGTNAPLNFTNNWNCWILSPSKDNSANMLTAGVPKSFLFDYGDKLGAVMDRMNNTDVRKQNFTYNTTTGQFVGTILNGAMRATFGTGAVINADADRNGQPLVLVDQVGTFQNRGKNLQTVMSPRWGETNSGVRLVKYPVYPGSTGLYVTNADNVYFRFAEVYFMLAECKLRKGDAASAKTLVNQVRQRYFSAGDWVAAQNTFPGFSAIDMDWMLSQWGLEFLYEGQRRRTDLKRFDKFTQGQWWFFGRAEAEGGGILPAKRDRKYEWYPIPQTAIVANKNLTQNPDYASE
jgi:hypothetical protein